MRGLSAIERLLLPLVRRFVGLWVRPSVLPDDVATRLQSGRPVLFALDKRSIIDFAVLEYVCRQRQLPMPLAPLGSGPQPLQSILFLEQRGGFLGFRIDRRLPKVLRAVAGLAANDATFDADIVPVSFFWGRAPDRERSWANLWIAEDWDIGGRFRKLLIPENNLGQLAVLLRSKFSVMPETLHKVDGRPFLIRDIRTRAEEVLNG